MQTAWTSKLKKEGEFLKEDLLEGEKTKAGSEVIEGDHVVGPEVSWRCRNMKQIALLKLAGFLEQGDAER